MSRATCFAAAGNTLAPALAVLRKLGYKVSRVARDGGRIEYKAEGASGVLVGEDTLQLLALATILQHRGENWQPSDEEVGELLRLDGSDGEHHG